jgi:mannose-6-phosphate isomerase-like protein (cupin superfamily)
MQTRSAMTLPTVHDVIAPDGSEVRMLLSLTGGSMAHFRLPAGRIYRAVRHRTVEEIWYVLSGSGEMWRSANNEVEALFPGTCVTIQVGTSFQFRALGNEPLTAVAVTMPPRPGKGEAELTEGIWPPTG